METILGELEVVLRGTELKLRAGPRTAIGVVHITHHDEVQA
jgi:hypothetical protein